jgi:hypothetical protein
MPPTGHTIQLFGLFHFKSTTEKGLKQSNGDRNCGSYLQNLIRFV